jgi:hypothetical protein
MIKENRRTWGSATARVACVSALGLGLTGCVSLESEEGRLPDAMRAAISNLSAKGYPDLTKIPDAPTNLPTATTWSALEAGLVEQGKALSQDPAAVPPTPEETNLDWAEAQRRALNSDPRAEPVPPVPVGGSDEVKWAADAKAKLDADLARLPPP